MKLVYAIYENDESFMATGNRVFESRPTRSE